MYQPKVGERVRIIKDELGTDYWGSRGYEIGNIAIVTKVKENDDRGVWLQERVIGKETYAYLTEIEVAPITPMEFRVGDKVEMLEDCSGAIKGNIYTIHLYNGELYAGNKEITGCNHPHKWKLIERSSPMSKYDSIKSRIDGITGNTSIKEVDDICNSITTDCSYNFYSNYITIYMGYSKDKLDCTTKGFTSQCSKLIALKESLLWLLNHSDIKDEKKEEIGRLRGEINKLQERLIKLENE